MEITNERGKSFGKLCGGPFRKDVTVDANGNYVWLQFHSDADLQKRGFLLYFSTFQLPSKYKKFTAFHSLKAFTIIMFGSSSASVISGMRFCSTVLVVVFVI